MRQCTIYTSNMEPVRMIPLEGGRRNGEYTLQVKSLQPGVYNVVVGEQHLKITLE